VKASAARSRTSPRPRVDTHAPYRLSRAQEAIGWAAKTGLIPDDWQADALAGMLAVHPNTGKWVHFEVAEWVSRQNGKGSILEVRALAGLFVFGEELIMWSAHEYKTAMEAFRRCLKLLRRIGKQVGNNENLIEVDGHVVKVSNTNGEEGFELLRHQAAAEVHRPVEGLRPWLLRRRQHHRRGVRVHERPAGGRCCSRSAPGRTRRSSTPRPRRWTASPAT
jgi:hypothetical protein